VLAALAALLELVLKVGLRVLLAEQLFLALEPHDMVFLMADLVVMVVLIRSLVVVKAVVI
jgi:hypothetical protein